MKKIAVLLVLLVIVGAAGARYWHGDWSGHPTFRTLKVTRGDLPIGVTATGMVQPREIIEVGAQIAGIIKSFGPDPDKTDQPIDYNSRVTKGGLLAQMDDLPYRAERDKARVNLQHSKAELDFFQAKRKKAATDLERAKKLRGVASDAEYEAAVTQDETAKAEMAMAEAKVKQMDIALDQAEINLGYTRILSPVDGMVIDRCVNVGQTVVAGMNAPKLFLLAGDLSRMIVCAAVNEADIGDVSVGQKVTFKVDAYRDRAFSGAVSQKRLNASQSQNVVMYGVVVDVDNSDGKLLPYMTAKLEFEVAHQSDVILVPNQALRWQPTWEQISPPAQVGLMRPSRTAAQQAEHEGAKDDGEPKVDLVAPTVWLVADDGLVRPVSVKVGLSNGIVTEITGGELQAGDEMVVQVVHEAQPDFVKSFILNVTGK